MKSSLLAMLIAVLLVGTAYAVVPNYDEYKYSVDLPQNTVPVPDVDKAGVNPPPPAIPNDNSCWQAAASNVLGAAGYGLGANAQARAQNIYGQITGALGVNNFGCCEKAVNWWLYNFGKNPNALDFQPANTYTDVTVVDKFGAGGLTYGIIGNDYDFLLGELNRCQYVTVEFVSPDHCMTLVGGNYSNTVQNTGQVCILHDSDRDQPDVVFNVDDDVYTNVAVGGKWNLLNYNMAGGLTPAMKYMTLCPGLNKPEAAMRNYDVAYFVQADANQVLNDPAFREAGAKADVFQDPFWDESSTETIAFIGNEVVPGMRKEVYLLVDYLDQVAGRQENVKLLVVDTAGVEQLLDPTSVEASLDDGQLLFTWKLDYQPAWEKLVFPTPDYKNLAVYVKDWDVATICVPEPGTFVLLAMAGVSALLFVWRKRRTA